MATYANYVNGGWTEPASGEYYAVRNPAKPSEEVGQFPLSTEADVERALAAAESARPAWAEMPGPQRGALLMRFAELLDASRNELARIITLEQGKALCESQGEVSRAAVEARYMAGEGSRSFGQTYPSERPGITCETVLEPVGIIAAISPWNFPVVTPVRKIAPALAFGNTVVFKPASLTPWSAVFLLQLLEKAGLPAGVCNLVIGAGSAIGDRLVSDERVGGITFTGSTDVGVHISESASRRMARLQLELGGKNPAVVIDYDDLDGAAREISAAAFLCSGQRCTAISRVLVKEDQADELVERLYCHVQRIEVGDGLADGTTMGPLVSRGQLETVQRYTKLGVDGGCKLIAGGGALANDPDREGFFFAPTLFDHVQPDSPLAMEEIFGPVLPVIRVKDTEQAIEVANGTRYGLAASVFTSQLSVIHSFAKRVRSGMVHVNHGTASQAHVPFGGVKASGQGAYSIGPTAREFYTNTKAIYVRW